jgi:predicted ABC-type transport system involved in lysophospholipase L1 biosynthesis ATPase subunit
MCEDAMTERESSELIRVEAARASPADPGWSFSVAPGEALWIPTAKESGLAWLDWLTGIAAPPDGEVFWKGVEWRQRGPDEAAAERGQIGCVFANGGLVANLDMDENVWLPMRMHRRQDAEEQVGHWSRYFECEPLPSARAPAVPERVRRRILWARAFAGQPQALVLERPLLDSAPADRDLLLDAVRRKRAEGVAVVWLDGPLTAEVRAALEPFAEAAAAPMQGA